MNGSPPVVNESIGPDADAMERIRVIQDLPDVQKIVALNDLNQGTQETPGSTAVATKHTIYPELTAEVINCGFSFIRTGLDQSAVTDGFVAELCDAVDRHANDLRPTRNDVRGMLLDGAEYVIEKYDMERSCCDHIENGGNMFTPETRPDRLSEFVPPWLLRYDGIYEKTPLPHLRGNHFIEFQTVREVDNREVANQSGRSDGAVRWGLSDGDVAIFLHGDYLLTYILFMHYTNREKFRRVSSAVNRGKLKLSKGLFHLLRGNLRDMRRQWGVYTNDETYTGFHEDSPEGRLLAKVLKAGMNFGYANRLLTTHCLQRAIQDVRGEEVSVELVWDVGHDTIQKEQVGDEEYWIHRKAAGKVVPGKPVLITGTNRMNSFIGTGLETATSHLNSYDHGSGSVVEYFEDQGNIEEIEKSTNLYDRETGRPREEVRHINPEPIEQVSTHLTEEGIVSPVAYLEPFVNISED